MLRPLPTPLADHAAERRHAHRMDPAPRMKGAEQVHEAAPLEQVSALLAEGDLVRWLVARQPTPPSDRARRARRLDQERRRIPRMSCGRWPDTERQVGSIPPETSTVIGAGSALPGRRGRPALRGQAVDEQVDVFVHVLPCPAHPPLLEHPEQNGTHSSGSREAFAARLRIRSARITMKSAKARVSALSCSRSGRPAVASRTRRTSSAQLTRRATVRRSVARSAKW